MPTSKSELLSIIQLLLPVDTGIPLVRIGNEGDGEYLVPDDLTGVRYAFSPGVGESWGFEQHLAPADDIHSHMIDGSVDPPNDLTEMHTFSKRWLATRDGVRTTSLKS